MLVSCDWPKRNTKFIIICAFDVCVRVCVCVCVVRTLNLGRVTNYPTLVIFFSVFAL
jgi:hypothetical protein